MVFEDSIIRFQATSYFSFAQVLSKFDHCTFIWGLYVTFSDLTEFTEVFFFIFRIPAKKVRVWAMKRFLIFRFTESRDLGIDQYYELINTRRTRPATNGKLLSRSYYR